LTWSLPPAFETAAWIARDDALWAAVSDLVRKALGFDHYRPLFGPTVLPSLIVADFPAFFAEFRGKRFTPLWRESRDGLPRARLSLPL
jgi:hypothetical protein